jgi:hypothetical protein
VLAAALLLPVLDAAAAAVVVADALDTVDGLLGLLENLNVGSRDTGFSGGVRVGARAGVTGSAALLTSIALVLDGRFLLRAAFKL